MRGRGAERRPSSKRPFILGLTGSIGMGKTTAARMLKALGFPVHSADAAVHRLLGPDGKAVPAVGRLFPEARRGRGINRRILGEVVAQNPEKLKALEAVLHPLVAASEKAFVRENRAARAVVLEIPLLFETGAESRCDATICMTATASVQRARVVARPGMTLKKFHVLRRNQWTDAAKRRKADFVVTSAKGLSETRRCLRDIVRDLGLLDVRQHGIQGPFSHPRPPPSSSRRKPGSRAVFRDS